MRIARFMTASRPVVAVDGGEGFIDYGVLLEARGFKSQITGGYPERRLVRMLRHGSLEPDFIREQLDWGKKSGRLTRLPEKELKTLLPLRPGKIVCMARNWKAHASETGHKLPESPVFFVKTENCAIGPGEAIPVDASLGRVDHEGELGVVISRKASSVPKANALDYVLGYTIVNDVTARELQHKLAGEGYPWFQAKSRDGFAPVGPWIVTRDAFEPLDGRRIKVTVNGEVRQDGSLDDMHFKLDEIIAGVTACVTLYPGDIIATGTPSGIGPLKPGDEVSVQIDGIGELSNPVS